MAAILLVGIAPPAMGQTASQGTLTGQITDQQGAVIPGVQIKVVDPSTNSTRETMTNENGRYTIPNIQPGTYNVTVTATSPSNASGPARPGGPTSAPCAKAA